MAEYGEIGFNYGVLHPVQRPQYGEIGFNYGVLHPVQRPQYRERSGFSVSTELYTSNSVYSFPEHTVEDCGQTDTHFLPGWAFDFYSQGWLNRRHLPNTSGHIQGTVRVEGVLWPGSLVRLYYRPTGYMVAWRYADQDGFFKFDNLPLNGESYSVVAFNDGFNAVVYDQVFPIDEKGSTVKPLNPIIYPLLRYLLVTAGTSNVLSNTRFSTSYYAHFVYSLLYTGPALGNSWLSTATGVPQKLMFIRTDKSVLKAIALNNFHDSGGLTDRGIGTFEVYGTENTAITVATDLTGHTLLGTFTPRAHVTSDTVDTQWFHLDNTALFTNYVIRIISKLPESTTDYVGIRKISLYDDRQVYPQ